MNRLRLAKGPDEGRLNLGESQLSINVNNQVGTES